MLVPLPDRTLASLAASKEAEKTARMVLATLDESAVVTLVGS